MWTDPLVKEIRKRRRELMAEFDYEPKKVIDYLRNVKESDKLSKKGMEEHLMERITAKTRRH